MNSTIRRIGATLVVLLMGTVPLGATSVLNFPRLTAEPGTLIGVAVVNPTAETARVSLTAYGGDGGEIGRTELEIPAGRQVGVLTADVFPGLEPSTVGWFQAFSETTGLTGFHLFLSLDGEQFDGAEPPTAARSIVFPNARIGDGFSTELNLVNPGPRRATVRLSLLGGTSPTTGELELEPRGVARLDAGAFFETASAVEGAYVLAESSEDLVGFQLIRLEGGDLVGLNARVAADRLNTLYFPQFAVSSEIRSELTLVNLSNQSTTVQVTAHRPDGVLVSGISANPRSLELAPGQNRVEDLAELFGFETGAVIEGWLEVRSATASINGSITYRVAATGAAAAVAPVARGSRRAILSHLATARGFFTGLAILNPGAAAANLTLVPLTRDGRSLGRITTVLRPGERFSRLITELFSAAAGQSGGFIFVSSNRPLFMTSLFGTGEGSVLANIPPQSAPEDFAPFASFTEGDVVPPWAALPPSGMQAFEAVGFDGQVTWSAVLPQASQEPRGSINADGLYEAPPVIPSVLPVSVTARGAGLAASASLDILAAEPLESGPGEVQRLAFLPRSQRLFALLSFVPPGQNPAGSGESSTYAVYEILPPEGRVLVADFGGERVSALVGVRSSEGEEFLVAASESGGLARIDPGSGEVRQLAEGLDSPVALAPDPITGGLLVAEANRISRLSRTEIETPEVSAQQVGRLPTPALAVAAEAGGVAVDRCSGNIFYSESAAGRVVEYSRADGSTRVVAEGLSGPSRLVPLYRRGLPCPFGFHLMVVQESGQGIALVVPGEGAVVNPWLSDAGRDAAALESEAGSIDAVASAGSPAGDGVVTTASVPDLYQALPLNPPQVTSAPVTVSPGPDLEIVSAAVQAGSPVTLQVRFRPGEAAADQIGALVFSIDYDRSRLRFDPNDADSDGVPDAIVSNLPSDYFLGVSFDAESETGGIGVVVVNSEEPSNPVPEGSLLTLTFTSLDSAAGTADVSFSSVPEISIANLGAELRAVDEATPGTVVVVP